jgi:hypothetical protein
MRKIMKAANPLINKEIKSSHKVAKIFVLLIRSLLFFWILFIIYALFINDGCFLEMFCYVTPQILLLICSFYSLKYSGILLIIDSLIIGLLIYPLICYGMSALIQCIILFVLPPLFCGIFFLIKSKFSGS